MVEIMSDLPVVIETRCKVDQALLFMVVFRLVENQVQLLATHKVFQRASFYFIEYMWIMIGDIQFNSIDIQETLRNHKILETKQWLSYALEIIGFQT